MYIRGFNYLIGHDTTFVLGAFEDREGFVGTDSPERILSTFLTD
jgi:hypothetical protein